MDSLHGILVFLRVVELKNLSATARQLGVTTSAVSSALTRLEQSLAVRLLNRTTRRMSLTPEGAAYYARCKEIVASLAEIKNAVGGSARIPSGTLCVAMPAALGRMWIIPHLPQFVRTYPAVNLEIFCSDYVPHTIDDGLDVAVQIGELQPSSLTARRLASIRRVVCASPSYLELHGTPRLPEELPGHLLLAYRKPRDGRVREWWFCAGSTIQNMPVTGFMKFNSGEALVAAAQAGLGIIQVAEYYVKDALKNGDLVEILPAFSFEGHIIYAVFSHQQPVPPKARVFVDFLVSIFGRVPWTSHNRATSSPAPIRASA